MRAHCTGGDGDSLGVPAHEAKIRPHCCAGALEKPGATVEESLKTQAREGVVRSSVAEFACGGREQLGEWKRLRFQCREERPSGKEDLELVS